MYGVCVYVYALCVCWYLYCILIASLVRLALSGSDGSKPVQPFWGPGATLFPTAKMVFCLELGGLKKSEGESQMYRPPCRWFRGCRKGVVNRETMASKQCFDVGGYLGILSTGWLFNQGSFHRRRPCARAQFLWVGRWTYGCSWTGVPMLVRGCSPLLAPTLSPPFAWWVRP